jgi:hypothetical protein
MRLFRYLTIHSRIFRLQFLRGEDSPILIHENGHWVVYYYVDKAVERMRKLC